MGHKSLMATAVNTGLVGPTLSWIPSVPRSTNIWNSSNLPVRFPCHFFPLILPNQR